MASENERIVALDTLRGIAILGILPVNVMAFAYSPAARDVVHFVSPAMSEAAAQALIFALCDAKFVTVFTFMFGVGLALQTPERGEGRRARLLWRLCLLAAIGAVHALGLWHGDILFVYAIVGIVLVPALRLPPWSLAALSALILAGTCVARAWELQPPPDAAPLATLASLDPSSSLAKDIAVFRDGGYGDMVAARIHIWRWTLVDGLGEWWLRTAAIMLLGVAACRAGVIDGMSRRPALRWCLAAGLALGLPVEVTYGLVRAARGGASSDLLELLHHVGSVALAAAYAAAVLSLPSAWQDRAPFRWCRAVGRIALTNYLLQSALCTTVFYGYGLGLFAGLTRVQLLAVVLAVWSLQIGASLLWLRWFSMGPVEWAWRSATLRERLPIRRARSTVAVAA